MWFVYAGGVLVVLTPLTGSFVFTAAGLLIMLSPVVILLIGEYRKVKRKD